MERDILNEELGIANNVNKIMGQIKSEIGSDFTNISTDNDYYGHFLINFPHKVYYDKIFVHIKELGINIIITYYVLPDKNEEINKEYLIKYQSSSDINKYSLWFYLTSHHGKIDWSKHSSTIQHEVEHLYQLVMKNKQLLTNKQMKEYEMMGKLRRSNVPIKKIIGFTYYYYSRIEKNAIINELYRKIIDSYIPGSKIDPMEVIKKDTKYKNIQVIKYAINDEDYLQSLEMCLNEIGKELKSYLRVANKMINEYTKAFGRLLYKVNKDIEEINKGLLINYNDTLTKD